MPCFASGPPRAIPSLLPSLRVSVSCFAASRDISSEEEKKKSKKD